MVFELSYLWMLGIAIPQGTQGCGNRRPKDRSASYGGGNDAARLLMNAANLPERGSHDIIRVLRFSVLPVSGAELLRRHSGSPLSTYMALIVSLGLPRTPNHRS